MKIHLVSLENGVVNFSLFNAETVCYQRQHVLMPFVDLRPFGIALLPQAPLQRSSVSNNRDKVRYPTSS
jgi:hypothetical protein